VWCTLTNTNALIPLGQYGHLVDAVRQSDKQQVILKKSKPSIHPYEVEIGRFLSSEELLATRANHAVPIHDVLKPPGDNDLVLIVMPLLRTFEDPQFETVGEAIDFFGQIFEVRSSPVPVKLTSDMRNKG
jgi:hypothetical protein